MHTGRGTADTASVKAVNTASQIAGGAGTPAALAPRVVATPAVRSIAVSSEKRATAQARPGGPPKRVSP